MEATSVRLLSKPAGDYNRPMGHADWLTFIASTRSIWQLQPVKVLDSLMEVAVVQPSMIGFDVLYGNQNSRWGQRIFLLSLKIMLWMLSLKFIWCASLYEEGQYRVPCVKNLWPKLKASWPVGRSLETVTWGRYAHDWSTKTNQDC